MSEGDDEAIANVEKLTGAPIKVFGKEDVRVDLSEMLAKAEAAKSVRSHEAEESEERPVRKPRRDREERGDERREERSERRPRRHAEDDAPVPAGEWNGPRPSFLDVGFG